MTKIRTTPIDHILSPTTSIYEILERQKKLESMLLYGGEVKNVDGGAYDDDDDESTPPAPDRRPPLGPCRCWHQEYYDKRNRNRRRPSSVAHRHVAAAAAEGDYKPYFNKYRVVSANACESCNNLLQSYQKFAYFIYGIIFSIVIVVIFRLISLKRNV